MEERSVSDIRIHTQQTNAAQPHKRRIRCVRVPNPNFRTRRADFSSSALRVRSIEPEFRRWSSDRCGRVGGWRFLSRQDRHQRRNPVSGETSMINENTDRKIPAKLERLALFYEGVLTAIVRVQCGR